jgi:hypothetical protein
MKKMHLKNRVGAYVNEYYASGWFIPMMANLLSFDLIIKLVINNKYQLILDFLTTIKLIIA